MLQALENDSSVVAYEVALSVQRLVKKYGANQHVVTWDLILRIMEKLVAHLEVRFFLVPGCKIRVMVLKFAIQFRGHIHTGRQSRFDVGCIFCECCHSRWCDPLFLRCLLRGAPHLM